MGKPYSTQLKIRNDTSSRITTAVSGMKAKQWRGPNRPDTNFDNVNISPGSEYSREQTINLRTPVNLFTLTLKFDNGKQLVFRIDQGRVAGKKRCRLRNKEKNVFSFVGDDTAFEVLNTISGNTLTIDIKNSYMFMISQRTEEARKTAERIAKEQAKAAALARAKAEEDKRAKDEEKARKEARDIEVAREEGEKQKNYEIEKEAERVANRLADDIREKHCGDEEDKEQVTYDGYNVGGQVQNETKLFAYDETDGGLQKAGDRINQIVNEQHTISDHVKESEENESKRIIDTVNKSSPLHNDNLKISNAHDNNIILTNVTFEPDETLEGDNDQNMRKNSEVTVQVTMNKDGEICVHIEESFKNQNNNSLYDDDEETDIEINTIVDSRNDDTEKLRIEETSEQNIHSMIRPIETHF